MPNSLNVPAPKRSTTYKRNIFNQIAERSQNAYFIYNFTSGDFLYLSPAFESIWMTEIEAALNDSSALLERIHPDDLPVLQEIYSELPEGSSERKLEFRLLDSLHRERFVRLYFYSLEDPHDHIYAGYCEDITVARQNIMYAEMINARKNSALQILSHDMKGQLGMISMFADSLKRNATEECNTYSQQSLDFISETCRRNIAMIRRVTNTELLLSVEHDLRRERSDLAWNIRDVVRHYQQSEQVLLKKFTFTSSSEQVYFYGDTFKIMLAVNNLISNAIKFTGDNGSIALHLEETDHGIIISVRDDGIGIPDELKPHLFDKFTRAGRTGLRGEDTVGLGMSIVKTIADLHGGSVIVESQAGKGTTVAIELPKTNETEDISS